METLVADKPAAAMIELLNEHKPVELADMLGVHNAHVYRFRKDGHMSPTLFEALIDAGLVEDSRRTKANGWLRRAVWIHEDDMPLFDALLARHGVRTLQELIDNHMIYRRRLDDD